MAYLVMAYTVMAHIVMATSLHGYGLYSYGLYRYGLYSHCLYSHGLCGYGLYSSRTATPAKSQGTARLWRVSSHGVGLYITSISASPTACPNTPSNQPLRFALYTVKLGTNPQKVLCTHVHMCVRARTYARARARTYTQHVTQSLLRR